MHLAADTFYMVSDAADQTASHAKALLDWEDCDYIESFGFPESD
jgi:hypothetical protein